MVISDNRARRAEYEGIRAEQGKNAFIESINGGALKAQPAAPRREEILVQGLLTAEGSLVGLGLFPPLDEGGKVVHHAVQPHEANQRNFY
jgi:hypothetical protein